MNVIKVAGKIIKSSKQAMDEAQYKINAEHIAHSQGIQTGLKSRWEHLNALIGKYFRFGNAYVLCGISGSGKSFVLNALISDFTSLNEVEIAPGITITPINNNFQEKLLVLNFNLEMKAEDEQLRTISSMLGVSYNYLLHSEYTIENGKVVYNDIDIKIADKLKFLKKYLDARPIWYSEEEVDTNAMWDICEHFYNMGVKLVITIDHMLLVEQEHNNDLKLAKEVSKFANKVKKQLDALVLILNQMNDGILETSRIKMINKHYPEMTDGFGGRVLYHGVDTYIFLHRPARIGIDTYGPYKIKTKMIITQEIIEVLNLPESELGNERDVMHIYIHKNRFGQDLESIFLLCLFHIGRLIKLPTYLLH